MSGAFAVTADAFLNGRVKVYQPAKGFRSGLDAVFLAAACPAAAGDRILEAGCGSGVASLCLLARVPAKATGVEVDADLAELARSNAAANGFAGAFQVVTADVTVGSNALEEAGVPREGFDHVMANPPYFRAGQARPSRVPGTARARLMERDGLDRWLRFLAGATKPRGTCTVIHPVGALFELLEAFRGRFGAVSVTPLYPKAGVAAIRVIVAGVKGSRAPISIEAGIVLHEDDGSPTPAARAILAEGAPLLSNRAKK